MILPLNLDVLAAAPEDQAKKLVLIKFNEMVGEINRIEQILEFVSSANLKLSENKDDVQ
jgi:hypothetical protein